MRLLLIYFCFVATLMTFGLQLVLWTFSFVQKRWRSRPLCFSLGIVLTALVACGMGEGIKGILLLFLAALFGYAYGFLGPIDEKRGFLKGLWFHFFLSLEVLALSLSFGVVAIDISPYIGFFPILGALIVVAGSIGLIVAKRERNRFDSNPFNRAKPCHEGLWGYSPNIDLFFEWTVYLGFATYLFFSPFGYAALVPLALKTALIRLVHMPQRKKDLVIKNRFDYQQVF